VRHGSATAFLRGSVDDDTPREIAIGIDRASGRKKISLDGVEVTRQIDALGVLPSVSWSPADVALVSGSPGERRRYLDVMLSLSSRSYVSALRRYRAALDRRNATIRDILRRGAGAGSVSSWEPALAEHGATLVVARREWAATHAPEFARLCAAVGEHSIASLEYESDARDTADPAAHIAGMLERERTRDMQRGTTGAGPHRDDLRISLDGRDARTFGSAGQQRTAAIALRLLEARTLRASSGGRHPVLLLDDPFAELDMTRTMRTLALLVGEDVGQVVLAVPRDGEIPAQFSALARWRVRSGDIATSESAT
jgi:DNA replication and repair protein RecF